MAKEIQIKTVQLGDWRISQDELGHLYITHADTESELRLLPGSDEDAIEVRVTL